MPHHASSQRKQVVILGGGFGGLNAARSLRRTPVDVTLVDRQNYHLFQPLLYQVATGGLSPANIAMPLRTIVRGQANCRVLQGVATGFDLPARRVLMELGELSYDYLVVATGATHSYFGNDHWQAHAPGLKTIEDATRIRAKVLSAFEKAERSDDPDERRRLLTFVVVGGGPTGVEMSGALSELSRHTLRGEFRSIQPEDARILLVDATPTVLNHYPAELTSKASHYLHKLGVTLRCGERVTQITPESVTLLGEHGEEVIPTQTVLWAAGVHASPLGAALAAAAGVETDRAGRVPINPDLTLEGFPEVSVIGDLASLSTAEGKPLPGVAPVAIQQGRHCAKRIKNDLRRRTTKPFRYRDYGSMATIGRAAAVVDMGRVKFAGFFAWLFWLFIHLMALVGFQSRLMVFVQWAWSYVTRNRSARLITLNAQQRSETSNPDAPDAT